MIECIGIVALDIAPAGDGTVLEGHVGLICQHQVEAVGRFVPDNIGCVADPAGSHFSCQLHGFLKLCKPVGAHLCLLGFVHGIVKIQHILQGLEAAFMALDAVNSGNQLLDGILCQSHGDGDLHLNTGGLGGDDQHRLTHTDCGESAVVHTSHGGVCHAPAQLGCKVRNGLCGHRDGLADLQLQCRHIGSDIRCLDGFAVFQEGQVCAKVVPQLHAVIRRLQRADLLGAERLGIDPQAPDQTGAHTLRRCHGLISQGQRIGACLDLAGNGFLGSQNTIQIQIDAAAVVNTDDMHIAVQLLGIEGASCVCPLVPGIADEEIHITAGEPEGRALIALGNDQIVGTVSVCLGIGFNGKCIGALHQLAEEGIGFFRIHLGLAPEGAVHNGCLGVAADIQIEAVAALIPDTHGDITAGQLLRQLQGFQQLGIAVLAHDAPAVCAQCLILRHQRLHLGKLVGIGDIQCIDLLGQDLCSLLCQLRTGVLAVGAGQLHHIAALFIGDQGIGIAVDPVSGQDIFLPNIGAAGGIAGALGAIVDAQMGLSRGLQFVGMIRIIQILQSKVQCGTFQRLIGGHDHGCAALLTGNGEPAHTLQGAGVIGCHIGEIQIIDGGLIQTHPGKVPAVVQRFHGAASVPLHILKTGGEHQIGADPQEAVAAAAEAGGIDGGADGDSAVCLDQIGHGLLQTGLVREAKDHFDLAQPLLVGSDGDLFRIQILGRILPGTVVALIIVHQSAPVVGHGTLLQQELILVAVIFNDARCLVDGEIEICAGNKDRSTAVIDGHTLTGGDMLHPLHNSRKLKLCVGQFMAGGNHIRCLCGADGQIQVVFTTCTELGGEVCAVRDIQGDRLTGRRCGIGQLTPGDDPAVLQQFPLDAVTAQIGEGGLIEHPNLTGQKIIFLCAEPVVLVDIPDLVHLGLDGSVRQQQAVLTEIAVVIDLAIVAAIAIEVACIVVQGLLGIGLAIVVEVVVDHVVCAVFVQICHIHPQIHIGIVGGDGRIGAVLGLDLLGRQRTGIDTAHGDGAVKAVALIGLIAEGEQRAAGSQAVPAHLHGVEQRTVHIQAHAAVVVYTHHLMPGADPVFGNIGGHGVIGIVVKTEHLQLAGGIGLDGDLGIALGHDDLIAAKRGGLADGLQREGLAHTGHHTVEGRAVGEYHIAVVGDGFGGQRSRVADGDEITLIAQLDLTGLAACGIHDTVIAGRTAVQGDTTTLIHQIPDEAAQRHLIGADILPVFIDTAGGIAHGVGILGHQPGAAVGCQILHHIALGVAMVGEVGTVAHTVGRGVGIARIHHRTGAVLVLEVPQQVIHGTAAVISVVAPIALVVVLPDDDAGAVLQLLQSRNTAVEDHFFAQGHLVACTVALKLMTLQIGLGIDIQAVLIAKIIEIIIVGVVSRGNCVDVVLLHDGNIQLHDLGTDILAVDRICLMAIGTLDQQPLAVDLHLPVILGGGDGMAVCIHLCPGKLDLPEAVLLGHGAHVHAVSRVDREHQIVQVGGFGSPKLRRQHGGGSGSNTNMMADDVFVSGLSRGCGDIRNLQGHAVEEHIAVLIVKTDIHLVAGSDGIGAVSYRDLQIHGGIDIVLIQIGGHEIVLDMNKRRGVQVDIPEDTAVLIHILQLEPGTVAEAMYLHGQQVLAVHQIIRHIKAVGIEAVLAVTHFPAVDIYIVGRFHTLQIQIDPAAAGLDAFIDGEGLAVQAHRVKVHRCCRAAAGGAVVLCLPGNIGIGIDRIVKTIIFPACGKLQPVLPDTVIVIPVLGRAFGEDLITGLVEIPVGIRIRLLRILQDGQAPVGLIRTRQLLEVGRTLPVIIPGTGNGLLHTVIQDARGGKHRGLLPVDAEHILIVDAVHRQAGVFIMGKFDIVHILIRRGA